MAEVREDTMADRDPTVSPYLLRPCRSLEEVLRARAVVASLSRPGAAGIPDAAEVAKVRRREAVAQAVAQVRCELFAVKEGLSAYATGDAGPESLPQVAAGMDRSVCVLRLLGHPDAAALAKLYNSADCFVQYGMMQRGVLKIGSAQDRAAQIGKRQTGFGQVRACQIGSAQIGFT